MKTLKKSLAVLLAVLMAAFSVPFSAFASVSDIVGNVEVKAYDIYADQNKTLPLPITWGLYDSTMQTPFEGTIAEGTTFALAFILSGVPEMKGFQIYGTYDQTKLIPVTPTSKKSGAYYKPTGWAADYTPGANWIDGIDNGGYIFTEDDTTNVNDGASFFGEQGQFLLAKDCGDNALALTGTTTFEGVVDNGTEVWDDYVLDGTLIGVCSVQAVADIEVDKLYDYFTLELDNINLCLVSGDNNVDYYVTFGPKGNDPQPAEKVTYTFADGSTQELDATAEAPANTAAKTEHIADTETHKVTTYSWAADGDKAFKEQPNETTVPCDFKETAPAVAPIHTADGTLKDGKTAVETCAACGFEKGGEVVKATHSYTMTHVDATCVVKAHDHYVCSVCGDAYDDNFTGELADHKWVQTGSSAADCQTPGTIDYECEVCHKTKTETGAYGAHKLTAHEAVAADCVNGGNDAYWTCDVCNKMFADAEGTTEITEIPATPAKGHTLTAHEAVAADCVNGGNDAYWTCDVCGKMFSDAAGTTEITEIPATPAKGHTWVNEEAIPANRAEEGREAGRYCTECDAREGYAVIPALGVDITVSGSSLGTATVNGEAVANAVKNVPYAQNYTLVATANAGAKFVGWKVADKLVSTEETYTTAAFADMTYVPVFAEDTADAFTITFVDAYDNVVTTVSSADLPLSELPAAPEFAGVTFDAWSLDLDAVNALTKAEKVVATYKNVEDKVYTVTAPEGCTITVNGEAVASPAAAAYNDTVTVTSAGAQGWSVNGSTEAAAYGETYTFYCGSDITVAPIAAVDAVPTVKAVSDNATGYQVKFLATRSVPEGYTLIESGFVYGKGMTADDLKLENVGKVAGNGTVKQAVCQNKAADGQFALTYGVKNMDAAACAVAYVICTGANGTVVYYSDAMIHSY